MIHRPEDNEETATTLRSANLAATRPGASWRTSVRAWKPLRDALIACLAVVVAALAASTSLRVAAEDAFRRQTTSLLQRVADATGTVIDEDAHGKIVDPSQLNGPEFQAVAGAMLRVRDAVEGVKYIYTARLDGDVMRFIVDCTPPGDADGDGVEDQAGVLEEYEDAPQELLLAAREDRVTWTKEPYTDRWGTFMSLFAPLRGRDGQTFAVLGIDMSVEHYEQEMAAIARASARGVVLAIVFGVLIGAFVFVLRSNSQASEANRRLAQARLESTLSDLAGAKALAEDASLQKSHHIAALTRAEKRILQVAQGVSEDPGERFLEAMTRRMAISLDADFAVIGVLEAPSNTHIRSLAFVDRALKIQALRYDLRNTPCEAVVQSGESRAYPAEVASLFPDDAELAQIGAEAYVGCPLVDSRGSVLGVVAVMYMKPLVESVSVVSMLRIFAARAAAELERQKVLDELLRSRERLASTFTALGEGVIVFSDNGEVLDFNPAALRILAVSPEELTRRFVAGADWLVHTEDGVELTYEQLPHVRALHGGESLHSVVLQVVRGDGESIWVDVAAEPIHGEGDSVVAAVVSFADVTDSKAARNALEHAKEQAETSSRAKSDFLANMSHEIRTPMTAILGYADLLRDEMAATNASSEWISTLDAMRSNGEHLIGLINDILDMSKIEAGKMTIETVATSIDSIVADTLAIARVAADPKGLKLVAEYETAIPPVVRTDPIRVRQVLVNLVGNAVKFTERGSVVLKVAAHSGADGVVRLRAAVTDTGIGMSVIEMSRLFGAFEQIDSSMTRKYGGTGLGLRISRRLAEMMGGNLTVASTKGKGSSFVFCIPVEVPETRSESVKTDVPSVALGSTPLAGLSVLVADDGADNRRILTLVLERAGARVRCVNDGLEAMSALTVDGTVEGALRQDPEFDLILMDMQMPRLDGYNAVRALRSRGLQVPVIAVTAHAMSADREACIAAGCDEHATKPLNRATLLQLCIAAKDGRLRAQPTASPSGDGVT